MTDLDRLIEAVDAGVPVFEPWLAIGHQRHIAFGQAANNGSLDAAKALHDALLPEWDFSVRTGGATVYFYIDRDEPGYRGIWCKEAEYGNDEIPARAWLLAILKAYRSQQEAT